MMETLELEKDALSTKIIAQLDRIEQASLSQKEILNFDEFCKYVGISKSWGYKLTSQRKVPYYVPEGKMLYFKRTEIDSWLLQDPVKTINSIHKEAIGKANGNSKAAKAR